LEIANSTNIYKCRVTLWVKKEVARPKFLFYKTNNSNFKRGFTVP
jgi:hypothetical protein